MKTPFLPLFALGAILADSAPAATLVALTSFGGGDGILVPADYGGSTSANTERTMAYNPATGNLVLVSRNTTNRVEVINGTTGASVKAMTAPAGGYVASTLNITAVGVTTDGQIMVTNLAAGGGLLTAYVWPAESSAAAPGVGTYTTPAGLRLGDSIDGIGSGASAVVGMGVNATAAAGGGDGFVLFNPSQAVGTPAAPTALTATVYDSSPDTQAGAFRLGFSFVDNDTVLGQATGPLRLSDFSAGVIAPPTTLTLTNGQERMTDVITIAGKQYLASVDTSAGTPNADRNKVRVYELNGTTVTLPLLAEANLIGLGVTTGNNTGDIEWGTVNGDTATLYTLTTNNGIQAFTFTVPEPSSFLLGIAGLGLLFRRRRP